MQDTVTGVEVDFTTGGITASQRHAEICKAAIKKYPGLKKLVLLAKEFLKKRDLDKTFGGGISTFLLVYMCIGFY